MEPPARKELIITGRRCSSSGRVIEWPLFLQVAVCQQVMFLANCSDEKDRRCKAHALESCASAHPGHHRAWLSLSSLYGGCRFSWWGSRAKLMAAASTPPLVSWPPSAALQIACAGGHGTIKLVSRNC